MKITKEHLKRIIKEELKNEGFYGRRFGGRSRSSYGSSYDDSYQKEEDPNWHARPGESFKVPGRAKLYYWVMEGDQKVPYARTFSFYGRKGPSSDETWKAFESVQEKFGDKFAGVMKDRGEQGVEIVSYPQEIEN